MRDLALLMFLANLTAILSGPGSCGSKNMASMSAVGKNQPFRPPGPRTFRQAGEDPAVLDHIVTLTGQWSLPMISGWICASVTSLRRLSLTVP